MAPETGQRVGDYEILALLGSGGMGRVYKVRNVISNREEAMKVLLPDFAAEPDLAARFMAEIRTLAGLEHPNIAQLRTAFQLQNQFVMVMEFVEGTTLDKLGTESRIPLDQVLEYSMQVLSALNYAHSRGVTHRDIKPANIMITSHGLVKLMDFGIAKSTNDMQLTRPGTTMGSVYYMSPEQVRGTTIDGRSDIYSFGVTLYEMLTGRKPFQAETSYSVLNAQLNEAPVPPVQVNPALSPELNAIVLRAMAKNPEERFQTADDFRNALKSIRQPQAVAAPVAVPVAAPGPVAVPLTAPVPLPAAEGYAPVPQVAAAAPQSKSHRGLWLVLGAVTALLALVAVAALLPRVLSTHANQKAVASSTQNPSVPAAPSDNSTPAVPPTSDPSPQQLAAAQPPATGSVPATVATPATGSPAGPAANASPLPKPKKVPASVSASQPAAAQPVPAGPSPEAVKEARDRMMNLNARASSASSGVEQIRRQQQAQGYDMRGDILASMSRMNNFLREADRALNQHNLESAADYMDRADREISTLEKFLGR